jgi:small subunit ribosomal protein S20
MPQRKCAQKSLRVDKKRVQANAAGRAELKKEIKGLRLLISQGKLDEAKEKLKTAYAKIDRASTKGLLHKNTAARRKAGLAVMLNKKA